MKFTNREVIVKNGKTFSIMKFGDMKTEQWNLVQEYVLPSGNKVFNSREECLEYIEKIIGGEN